MTYAKNTSSGNSPIDAGRATEGINRRRFLSMAAVVAAANQIGWFTSIPAGAVKVTVREGWVTLEGEVEWAYQKNNAEDTVQNLAGVRGVNNLITIKSKLAATNIKGAIEDAFERSALLDAGKIQVETAGSKVTLTGKVRNYAERDEAERAAWAAAGVWSVVNNLEVKWPWEFGD